MQNSKVGSNHTSQGPPIQVVVGVTLIIEFYDHNMSFMKIVFGKKKKSDTLMSIVRLHSYVYVAGARKKSDTMMSIVKLHSYAYETGAGDHC